MRVRDEETQLITVNCELVGALPAAQERPTSSARQKALGGLAFRYFRHRIADENRDLSSQIMDSWTNYGVHARTFRSPFGASVRHPLSYIRFTPIIKALALMDLQNKLKTFSANRI